MVGGSHYSGEDTTLKQLWAAWAVRTKRDIRNLFYSLVGLCATAEWNDYQTHKTKESC